MLNVHRNHKAYWGQGEGGKGVWRSEILYLPLHCHHQNDSCIKMDSDESRFNVSLIARDKVARQCPQATTFEEKGEPKRIRTDVPLLTTRPNGGSLPLSDQLRPYVTVWREVAGGGGGGGGGTRFRRVWGGSCGCILGQVVPVDCGPWEEGEVSAREDEGDGVF